MEFSGLAGFVLIAGLITIFFEHPDLPVMKSALKHHNLLRRVPLGIIMGLYIAAAVMLFGKKSGAHMNPAVTWTFYRLGKINFINACFYSWAQIAGAVGASQLLKYTMPGFFDHALINYGVTEPKPPHGIMTAFIAEFIISFILMLALLTAGSSKRLDKYLALISGNLICLYLIAELPLSGMSLNPARSFAGALAANEWNHLWVYVTSPTLAMIAASEVFRGWEDRHLFCDSCDPNVNKMRRKQTDYKKLPNYPIEAV